MGTLTLNTKQIHKGVDIQIGPEVLRDLYFQVVFLFWI